MDKNISAEKLFPSSHVTQCPICHSNLLGSHPHTLYKQCGNCLAIWQISNIDTVNDYYSGQNIDSSHQVGSYKSYLRVLSRFTDRSKGVAIADIGAGDGTFLDLCQEFGFKKVLAIEASAIAKKVLNERGFKLISVEEISEIGTPKVVTLFQVIEHLLHPRDLLGSIHLQEGDYLVITSPAVDSIYCKMYGQRWKSLSPSHHVMLYSRKALECLCKDLGLKVVYFDLCFSACHGWSDNFSRYILDLLKFPLKIMLGRKAPFPLYHGKNSFLAILAK